MLVHLFFCVFMRVCVSVYVMCARVHACVSRKDKVSNCEDKLIHCCMYAFGKLITSNYKFGPMY